MATWRGSRRLLGGLRVALALALLTPLAVVGSARAGYAAGSGASGAAVAPGGSGVVLRPHAGVKSSQSPGKATLTSADTPTRPPKMVRRIRGWLHTDGRLILDARGNQVRLLSINMQGLGQGAGQPWNGLGCPANNGVPGWKLPQPGTYANIARWGFNSVRLAISWENLEPTPPTHRDGRLVHHYNRAYLRAIDRVVAAFRSVGVAVILDMHQWGWTSAFPRFSRATGAPLPCRGWGIPVWAAGASSAARAQAGFFEHPGSRWTSLAAAWRLLARRYARNPSVVGFDLFNEPYLVSGMRSARQLHLNAFYRVLGAAIRSVNSHALLIFEDSQDRGAGNFALTGPPPFPGVVYSFHLYAPSWRDKGRGRLLRFVARARAWNVPAWIGEFNAFGHGAASTGGFDARWQADTRALLATAKRQDVGWAFWVYDGGGNGLCYDNTDTVQQPELLRVLRAGL